VGLTVALVGCSGSNQASTVVAAAPGPIPTTTQATPVTDSSTFLASGPIVVEHQVDVAALREGVVVSILAGPATAVRKGQLLAQLDNRQISADLEAAAARVRSIAANLKNWQAENKVLLADRTRAEKMWEAQLITREALDHARYKEEADVYEIQRETESLNNAKATQKSLELEKEKTRIISPFDGVVARRYVRVGQKVAVGDRLFWVTAVSPLQVKFTLPERFVTKVKKGQIVTVMSADATPAIRHTARVIEVSPVVDPSSSTIEVLARVEGAAPDLRPGMLANVGIDDRR